MKAEFKNRLLTGLGFIGIGGFLYLYAVKLFGQHGKPPTSVFIEDLVGRNGLIVVNILILACFLALLPYRVPGRESHWKSKGAFVGFFIALFTEMFGLPLVIFIFSPFFDYPFILPFSRKMLGGFGMIAGTWLTLAGIALVFLGWHKIHKAEGLVTDGVYGYIRHPQYAGLFLIMFGWLIHWPTLLTLILFPILVGVYYGLAMKEEKGLEEVFGAQYQKYKARTQRFFPRLAARSDARIPSP
ncbi:MAG: isoprenylcysteine carboxylmethyltransferase family protein [Deltaproteobacteria bacterium]|nr:MAG: isoprenylcysteine carboxylmethyltransferase family protein [Deltaproteobacteria bacterium]